MKNLKKRLYIIIYVLVLIAFSLSGCSNEKNITISEDVKNEKLDAINGIEKIKQLNISNNQQFSPFYWKDDNNIIAEKFDAAGIYGIYNINVENSEVTKINEIKATKQSFEDIYRNTKLITYVNDKKLYVYDAEKNSSVEICNLDDVLRDIKVKFNINTDITQSCRINFIEGSDNYIVLTSRNSYDADYEEYIKIIDIKTKMVTELSPRKDISCKIYYSKFNNLFYYNDLQSQKVYSFSKEKPDDFKEILGVYPFKFIDENGESAYYSIQDKPNEVIRYDIKNNKSFKLEVKTYVDVNGETDIIGLDYIGRNIILYVIWPRVKSSDTGEKSGDQSKQNYDVGSKKANGERSFTPNDKKQYFGTLDGDKINIFGKYETTTFDFGTKFIINDKGDKIFNVNAKSSEDNKYYIYKITK